MASKSEAKRSPEPSGTGKKEIMLDAKSLVKEETRKKAGQDRTWFECDPEKIFPVVIARILYVIENQKFPQELVDNNSQPDIDPRGVARQYLNEAKKLYPKGFEMALQDRAGFYKAAEIKERAAALDLARRWFTQALHVQIGGDGTPLGVHILNKPAFRKS